MEEEFKRFKKRMEDDFELSPRFEFEEFREPLADIEESENEIVLTIELLGVSKEDINLQITRDSIKIKAERKKAEEVRKKGFYRAERSYKGFYRAMSLPTPIDINAVRTEYKEGILKIIMPKLVRKAVEARKIKIS